MTLSDFSNGFDTLLNSYALTAGFGSTDNPGTIELDEYEKSQFLTKAQEEEVVSLYTGKNMDREGFEQTEEMRRYLSNLIEEAEMSPIETSNGKPLGIDSNSKFFSLPDGSGSKPAVWFITYESVAVSNGKCGETALDVYPVRQDEYQKLRKNPFRGANGRRALRLDLSDNNVEIVSSLAVTSYYIRYIRKVKPIILADLGKDISIEGLSEATPCELHESLHQRILERAVIMALQSRGYNRNNNENR